MILLYAGGNADLLYCPANPASFRHKKYPRYITPFDPSPGSYGYNALGTGFRLRGPPPSRERVVLGLTPGAANSLNSVAQFLPSSAVKVPSDMIAIGDNQSDGENDFAISSIEISGAGVAKQSWPGKRHRHGANIVFCDGHVEHARQKKWLERELNNLRRWNRDNEPHTEVWLGDGKLLKYAE